MKASLSITIITPCFNRQAYITEAIESVLKQKYENIEHIIIDGGSTDGTLEKLNKYPHLKIISEKDNGLYDAINKGLALAKGDIIGILNSDDLYAPDIFNLVAKTFESDPALLHICGRSIVFKKNDGNITIINRRKSKYCMKLKAKYIIYHPFQINARFFRKEIFKNYGKFSLDYPVMADLQFMLRLTKYKIKSKYYYEHFYSYRSHPGSITFSSKTPNCHYLYTKKIQIIKDFLKTEKNDKKLAWLCRNLHAKTTFDMVVFKLKYGDYSDLFNILRDGFRSNLLLPLLAFRYVYWYIFIYIKVKFFAIY